MTAYPLKSCSSKMIGTVQKQIKIDEKRSQMRDEFVRKIKQIETKKEKEQKLMEKIVHEEKKK